METHGENLTRDPIKRALFIRDLWAVFDWSVSRAPMNTNDPTYGTEKRELQERLAEILHRLSLTSQEIESLPDNYAQALGSGEFAKEYDPSHPERAFLPTDLFDQHGPWVMVQGTDKPAAEQHVSFFSGRSRFLIFIRLPGGRKATYDYLHDLWQYPQPWIDRADAPDQADINPALPPFPAGTQVALVRQMTIFDDHGNLRRAPITESIQIRVFRSVTPSSALPADLTAQLEASGQHFYEIRLDRKLLFSGPAGGLRAVARDEKDLFIFNAIPIDGLDNPKTRVDWSRIHPIVQQCVWCHARPGIQSLNSRAALLKPNPLQRDPGHELPAHWWDQDGTLEWKKRQADWGLLNGYWKQSLAY